MNSKTNYGLEEAGMAQMDDSVGALLKHLDDIGEADNTIVVFTTDNGAEVFTWPDGGMTPFKATKGTVMRRRLPRAVHHPLAGQDQAGHGRERHLLRPRLVPHARAPPPAIPNITDQLLKGVKLGDRDLQEPPRRLQPAGPADRARGRRSATSSSTSAGRKLGAVRIDDFKFQFFQQPQGWPGPKVTTDMPTMVNIRQDPFERTPSIARREPQRPGRRLHERLLRPRVLAVRRWSSSRSRSWRKTAIDYPPMQDPASFNLDAVKRQIEEMIKQSRGR